MSGRAHRWVRRWWEGRAGRFGRALLALAAPLEWIYAWEAARRGRVAAAAAVRVQGLRVVSVGNLVVGGTGKTPLAAWVVRRLQEAGAQVALVARGYGRDELLLHERWNPGTPVVADPDRVAAARKALAGGAGVVVLDDGFQHRRLARDLDVVLLAAEDPFPGRLLPRGPYREPSAALARAHVAIVTRRTAPAEAASELALRIQAAFPHLQVAVAALLPGPWQALDGTDAAGPTGPTLAVAAVARPEAFARQVRAETGQETGLLAFADHHAFSEADARAMRARARARTVVVTEKDAVKLQAFAPVLDPCRVLTQKIQWEAGEETVNRLVAALAAPATKDR